MLTLRLMGGFALLDDAGAPVTRLSQRRAEAVLALLALAGDVGCSRDRLVALLWPEADADHARHNLRSALHAIRAAVGPQVLVATGDALRINSDELTCDVARFARALADRRLDDAVAAYGGALLDGFHVDGAPEFERFIEEERGRLYRKCAEAIETLARGVDGVSGPQGGVAWWMRAAEHDPHNSRVAAHLMRALAKMGDPANALLHAELHRRRLLEDLDIAPDAQFEAEVERLRREHQNHTSGTVRVAPSSRSHAADAPPAPPAPPALAALPTVPAEVAMPRYSARRRWLALSVLVVVVASLLVAAGWWRLADRRPAVPDPDRVAVAPFTWGGHPQFMATARELRTLLVRALRDGPAPLPVDLERMADAVRGESSTDGDALAVDAELSRRTGASLVLRGDVDSTQSGRVLTLVLSRFPARRVIARRSAVIVRDSADFIAHRLLLEVLALEADQPAHRIPELLTHPASAVRIYLAGVRRSVNPLGVNNDCQPMLKAAWRIDSSLVYPGLACLATDGYTVAEPSFLDSVARAVWKRRATLAPEDAAFTDALVGPRFGRADNAEQRIALWQAAAHIAPSWWVPWGAYAQELANFGSRTTLIDWRPRALAANARALELTDWSQRGPVEMAFWSGIFDGDSALSRRALAAAPRIGANEPVRPYTHTGYSYTTPDDWRWLFEAAFGTGGEAMRLRPVMPRFEDDQIILTVLAIGRPGTSVYADSLLTRWERTADGQKRLGVNFWTASYWQIRGDYRRWRERWTLDYTSKYQLELSWSDDVAGDSHALLWQVLHLGAPEDTVFRRGLARLQRIAEGDSLPAPTLGMRGVAACWVSQWRLSHGDTTGVQRAITLLRDLDAKDRAGLLDGLPGSGRWVICPALLEAQRARVLNRGALEAARRLDRLMRPLPLPRRHWWSFIGNSTHDNILPYSENLDVARLLAQAGDTAAALAAVRRRPWYAKASLDFFQTPNQHLRLEGRLAAAMLDTSGAIVAYQNYLSLRPTPPAYPPWRAEWDSVRAELARMKKPRP